MSTGPISGSQPLQPTLPTAIDPTTSTSTETGTTAETSLPPAASYLSLPFARLSVERLGILSPTNPEATEAILAEVQLALEQTVKDTENNRIQARTSQFRTALSQFAGIVADMMKKQEQLIELQHKKDTDQAKLEQKTAERDAKIKTRDGLQTQINSKNSEINQLNGVLAALNVSLAGVNAQITVVLGQKDQSALPGLIEQRDDLQAAIAGTTSTRNARISERNALQTQKNTIDNEIKQLDAEIKALKEEIATLDKQIADTTSAYFTLSAIMLNVFTQMAMAVGNVQASDATQTVERNSGILRAFDDLASNINEFGDLLKSSIENQAVREQVRDEDDVRARVLQAAAGLVIGLAELVQTLQTLEPPPSLNAAESAFAQNNRLHLPL